MRKKSRNWKRAANSLIGLLALPLVLAGCVTAPTRPAVELPAADTLLLELITSRETVRTFAGRGRIRYKDPRSQYDLDLLVAAEKPQKFRFQVFDPMGRPSLTLVAEGERLHILDYQEKRFFEGPVTPENMRRFLPIGLSLPEVIAIFSGDRPLSAAQGARISAEGDQWLLTIKRARDGLYERILLNPADRTASSIVIEDNAPIIEAAYTRYAPVAFESDPGQTRILPRDIRIHTPEQQAEVTVKYDEIKVNAVLPEKTFQLQPPEGMTVEPLPAHGGDT